jgi:hypothetical protein
MRYALIQKTTPESLVEAVNKYLLEGWEVQGGVTVGISDRTGSIIYLQALVKKEKKTKKV